MAPLPLPESNRRPDPRIELLASVKADGSRVAIHPSDVKGRFITRRRQVWAALLAFYVLLPLWRIGGHPAVHLDVADRRFYLFGGTYNAQDFWIALFVLLTLGFTLLFVTAWLGRAWCGWACPQTVFLEGVFRPIERLFDGPRERRLKAQHAPWTVARALRAIGKHAVYLLVASVLAHVALSLFVSLRELFAMIREGPVGHWAPFVWASVLTGLLYFDFAFFREQFCTLVCPYGRLQSVLTDRHTLIVGYDVKRGEPRGRLVKAALDTSAALLGDCVDCRKCVTACPTGIDIRQGLQLECVACAQCVDACDEVMDKVGRKRGLIRFDSLAGLEGVAGETRRVFRPRLVAYGALCFVSVAALVLSIALRSPFEAHLQRAAGMPWQVDGERVENQFELHLVNKGPDTDTFDIRVLPGAHVDARVSSPRVEVASLDSVRVPVTLSARAGEVQPPFRVSVEVTDRATGKTRIADASFLGPRVAAGGHEGARHEHGDEHERDRGERDGR